MIGMGKRFLDWSVGSIVGNIVWGAVAAIGLFYFNESTGCVYIVLDSMRGHELELAGWTIAFALFGALVGLMIRHRVAIGQLKAKDDEIAKAVDDATKPLQEQIDRLMNRENFALMRLRGLSLKELGIVKRFMTQSGEVHLKVDDASVRKLTDSGMIRINTDTYCPPDLFPFTLDDSLRSLLTEFPDTLDRAIAEAESVKSRYGDA